MDSLRCPTCGCESATSVPSVALAGSYRSNFDAGAASQLALTLAPPAKPKLFTPLVVGYFIALAIGLMAMTWGAQAIQDASLEASPMQMEASAAKIIEVALFLSACAVGFAFAFQVPARSAYPGKRARWARLMYCARCHVVFDPLAHRAVSAERMQDLLQ